MRHDDVFRKTVNFFGNIEEFVAWIVSERDIFGKNIGKNTAEKKDFVTVRD